MGKVHIEFDVSDGREAEFISQLEELDKAGRLTAALGWRAGDEVQVRQQLRLFTEAMELKLRKNDHKTGWRDQPLAALYKLMLLEVKEFKVSFQFFTPKETRPEAVDIANFALILWDRLGMLEQDEPVSAQYTEKAPDVSSS